MAASDLFLNINLKIWISDSCVNCSWDPLAFLSVFEVLGLYRLLDRIPVRKENRKKTALRVKFSDWINRIKIFAGLGGLLGIPICAEANKSISFTHWTQSREGWTLSRPHPTTICLQLSCWRKVMKYWVWATYLSNLAQEQNRGLIIGCINWSPRKL